MSSKVDTPIDQIGTMTSIEIDPGSQRSWLEDQGVSA
jgi:hypothetical protein